MKYQLLLKVSLCFPGNEARMWLSTDVISALSLTHAGYSEEHGASGRRHEDAAEGAGGDDQDAQRG